MLANFRIPFIRPLQKNQLNLPRCLNTIKYFIITFSNFFQIFIITFIIIFIVISVVIIIIIIFTLLPALLHYHY